MFALILKQNNKIKDVQAQMFPVAPAFEWVECPENCKLEWDYDPENGFSEPQKEETQQQLIKRFRALIKNHLSAVATEKEYYNEADIVSYVTSSIAAWKAQAQAFIAWRDQVWVYARQEILKIINGQRTTPSEAEFINELPQITWP